jgi:DNA mismatch repair ATPase MutS
VIAALLGLLERARFEDTRLTSLRSRLDTDGVPASGVIRRLHLFSEMYDSQKNVAIIPLGLFLMAAFFDLDSLLALAMISAGGLMLVRPHVALAVTRWRARYGRRVRVWIDTIAEFEALSSLAGYRYEHEHDSFPEIVSSDDGKPADALFEGLQLGHPLLPRATMVPNDVRFAEGTRLLIVSGSNMSGKSTLLRSIGVAFALAYSGGPVCATRFELGSVRLATSLRIRDSLEEGVSHFYAELQKLKAVLDATSQPLPVLFLLDEILHGTNSRERQIGARWIMSELLQRGALGAVSTHDMELCRLSPELMSHVRLVHLREDVQGQEMTFDYRLREGPVSEGNALRLMRRIGLPVPESSP